MAKLKQTDDIEKKAVRGRRYATRNADELPVNGGGNGNGTNGSGTAVLGEDVALAFDEFMRAFESFKLANDERLAQIEQSISADVVTTEKLDRINRTF
jgi:hypothetical protein